MTDTLPSRSIPVFRPYADEEEIAAPTLLPRILPLLVLGCLANGLGGAIGCGLGMGRSAEQKFDMEFHRHRFMTEEDRRTVLGEVSAPGSYCPRSP